LAFALFVFLSFLHILFRPGNYPVRRLVNMTGDYGSLAIIMILGEQAAMPFYALVLWVTLGNGMRFGQRYLLIAAIMAQLTLLALILSSPYWRGQFELMVTFSITAVALPTYALMLLRETSKARDAAQAATLAKSRFLAQASHDLRQPIHAVGYYIGALRHSAMNGEQIHLVDRIERALGGVARLFKSLLDIAKLDSGTLEVRPETVAIKPLISEIIANNDQFIQWSDVELHTVLIDATVDADPTLLTTMIQNLLSNAIKYSRGKKILVGVRQRGSTVSVEIYDQGVGIDREHLPHVFEEFYRGHAAGDHDSEGVGLGLAILQRIATLCGFSIALDSKRGVGTSVRLSGIPVSRAQVAFATRVAADVPRPLANLRVILLEDDIDVLEATERLLNRWGCVVQAYTKIPENLTDADIIISDFDLGVGVTGIAAIAAVRAKLSRPLPAILMTGHAEESLHQHIGTDDVVLLTKPVQPATLRSVLSSIRIKRLDQF
jgi:signal transduction histidine kinase